MTGVRLAGDTPPDTPPQLPPGFDELVRRGVRVRWAEAFANPLPAVLLLAATTVGLFIDGYVLIGFLFLVPTLAPHAVLIHRMRRHYGVKGERWKQRVSELISEPSAWHPVELTHYTFGHRRPRAETHVLVAEPGQPPRVAGIATLGTALGLRDGRGWTWGVACQGEPLIVYADGRTLFCIGPTRGRWWVWNLRCTAGFSASSIPPSNGVPLIPMTDLPGNRIVSLGLPCACMAG